MRQSTRLLRSAADATRFTATPPHAYSAPSSIRRAAAGTFSPSSSPYVSAPSSSNVQPNAADLNPSKPQNIRPAAPAPPPRSTETPAQKVARLRAARLAEKVAQVSTWDKVVVIGREWADRVHRTVCSDQGTVVSFVVTSYTLTDMVIYNRRKRKAWMKDQIRIKEELVMAAIENEKAGHPLTGDQELALNNERARFQAEERRKAKGGIIKRLTTPFTGLFAGMRSSESGEEEALGDGDERDGLFDRVGQRLYEIEEEVVDGLQKGVRRAEWGLKETVAGNLSTGGKQAEQGVLAAVHEAGQEAKEKSREGPLEQMAENENMVENGKAENVENPKRGWFGWK
ncbi:MAG: hypothetical protein Q9195_004567 [Heterodermia aff. obscurata]